MALMPPPTGVAGPGPQGAPPPGTSPVTAPTPNLGDQVRANAIVGAAINALTMAVPMYGAQTEMGQELLTVIQRLAKKVPPGASSEAGHSNALEAMRMKQMQQAPLLAALRQRAMAQGAGGAPPASPGGAPPSPGGPPLSPPPA